MNATSTPRLSKRARRAAQLEAHYLTCSRLAVALGSPRADGKKIAVALFHLEKLAHSAAEAACNGERFVCYLPGFPGAKTQLRHDLDFSRNSDDWGFIANRIVAEVNHIFGRPVLALRINSDPRGYAIKIDSDTVAGVELIQAAKLATDMGGDGILSPEITGD